MKDYRKEIKNTSVKHRGDWDDEELWLKIEERLDEKKGKKMIPFVFRIALVLLIVSAALFTYYSWHDSQHANSEEMLEGSPIEIGQYAKVDQELSKRNRKTEIASVIEIKDTAESIRFSDKTISSAPNSNDELLSLIDVEGDFGRPNPLLSIDKQNSDESFISAKKRNNSGPSQMQDVELSQWTKKDHAPFKAIPSNNILTKPFHVVPAGGPNLIEIHPIERNFLHLLNSHTKFEFAPVTPLEYHGNTNQQPWQISVEGGVGFFTKEISSASTQGDDLAIFRSSIEMPERKYYFNVSAQKPITKWGLGVYAGFTYNFFSELISYRTNSVTERDIFSDEAIVVIQSDGTRVFLPGFITESTTVVGQINLFNQTRFYKIPFGISYTYNFGSASLEAYLGSALALGVRPDGDIVLIGDEVVVKSSYGSVTQNIFNISSINAGVRLHLSLSPKFLLFTNFGYDVDQFRLSGEHTMDERFRSLNLGLGVKMNLNSQ